MDCPADATANRVRTLDIRMLAGDAAVHSDMLMWHPAAPVEAAARQLHGALYSVPQVSVRLSDLSPEHRQMLAFWLRLWRDYGDVLSSGAVEPGRPDELYHTVVASAGPRAVVASYVGGPVAVDCGRWSEVVIVNATATSRVVLDLSGHARADLDIRDALGRPVEHFSQTLQPGLLELSIPASGLCLISGADG